MMAGLRPVGHWPFLVLAPVCCLHVLGFVYICQNMGLAERPLLPRCGLASTDVQVGTSFAGLQISCSCKPRPSVRALAPDVVELLGFVKDFGKELGLRPTWAQVLPVALLSVAAAAGLQKVLLLPVEVRLDTTEKLQKQQGEEQRRQGEMLRKLADKVGVNL